MTIEDLRKKKVVELRPLAKSLGLRGYSKLNKAPLIQLIEPAVRAPRGGAISPPTPAPRTKRPTPAPRTIRPTPAPRTQKTFQRGKELASNFIQSGTELVEALPKQTPKAFNWVREKVTNLTNKVRSAKDSIADMINKNLAELTKSRRPKSQPTTRPPTFTESVKDELNKRQQLKLVESRSSLKQFANQYTIDVSKRGFTDLRGLLAIVQPLIITHLCKNRNIKAKIVVECVMSKTNIATGNQIVENPFFHGFMGTIFEGTNLTEFYQRSVDKIMESLSSFQKEGSNWVIESIANVALHTVKHKPLSGSSYIPLPATIMRKKAIINMKNEDNECFKWSVARWMNPVDKNPERITNDLRKQSEKLNWEGIVWPMKLKDINKFEKMNNISVNVFGLNGTEVYPLRPSKFNHETEIDLLLIHDDEKQHYCLIKDMSRLLSAQTSKKQHKKFFCKRCLNSFGRQDLLDKHKELCGQHEEVKVVMPEEGSTVSFRNFHKKIDVPFVIYADFESKMKAFHSAQPNPNKAYTEKLHQHEPLSYCYYVKCNFDDRYSKTVEYTAMSEDEDVSQRFVDDLVDEVKSIYASHPPKAMIFTESESIKFNEANECWICGGGFDECKNTTKVRDHCHFTGKFRGAAHSICNLKARVPKFIPVIFHNLSGYDAHLFVKNLGVSQGKINCIPNNKEKYISFTKEVEVSKTVDEEGKEVSVKRELRFIDSAKFMGASLASLVENLVGVNDVRCDAKQCEKKVMEFRNIDESYVAHFKCKKCGGGKTLELKADDLQEKFSNTANSFINIDAQFRLLLRKGVYPYEWMDSLDKMKAEGLPPPSGFYSRLTGESITSDDYEHAKQVWNTFNMKTFRDYHNLYNKSDVLLLADVFENFRKVCKKNYELDPCWYYTAPGLAWDACLKLTKINLELLTDPDMLLMVESGLRGGISMISNRYGKANNKYMNEKHDPSKPSKYIVYLDANNLYGWAMSQKLPHANFKWMSKQELDEWRYIACILEVEIEYPEELHDLHNDYPLAPERLMMNGVEKLIPNLNDKERYVVHHETLKLYESLGLKIKKIHRGIKFTESEWLKEYIDLNTKLRAQSNSDFEKDFFKLMNNSVFGKTMENVRKRVDIHLVNSEKRAAKLTSRPNFKHLTIFNEDLSAIEMKKTKILYNKPVYLGMSILDLSKTLMYDFHYNYIKPKYGEKAKLLFTDTDSLAYEIETEDFYKDIKDDVKKLFDTSNYPENHPIIQSGLNKKVVGMFKDEAGGKIIEEFVGLRAKLYSYKMFEGKEEKKCKGVKKSVVAKDIKFDDYKRCLFEGETQLRKMTVIRSRLHEVYTEEINKVALSGDDDKRYILPNRVNTLALGHYHIPPQIGKHE